MYGNRPGLYRVRIQIFNTADDTGFFDRGSQYHVAIDSVTVDGKTVRFFPAVFEIDRQRVNVWEVSGDTGAANYLRATFAAGFADTGINQRLAQIQSDVDTGLRVHVDDSDTGVKAAITAAKNELDTGIKAHIDDLDTGLANLSVSVAQIRGDTGAADRFLKFSGSQLKVDGTFDTGTGQVSNTFNVVATAQTDTGAVSNAVWNSLLASHGDTGTFGELLRVPVVVDTGGVTVNATATVDTGAIVNGVWGALRSLHADTGSFGEHLGGSLGASVDTGQISRAVWQADAVRGITAISDTGINERFTRIQSDVDTGLRSTIEDMDTGLRMVLAVQDTGAISNAVWAYTGRKLAIDTGIADQVWKQTTAPYADDTGTFGELLRVASTVDTGTISNAVWVNTTSRTVSVTAISDTGVNQRLGAVQTKTDSLTFTVAGQVDANIQSVNDVTVGGTGANGDEWGPA